MNGTRMGAATSSSIDLRNVGVFVLADWPISTRWEIRAGLRHERASASVDDFTTLAGNQAVGDTIDYDDTHYNAGAVFYATNDVQIFGNFAQGFSLPDIGLVLRGAPDGAPTIANDIVAKRPLGTISDLDALLKQHKRAEGAHEHDAKEHDMPLVRQGRA